MIHNTPSATTISLWHVPHAFNYQNDNNNVLVVNAAIESYAIVRYQHSWIECIIQRRKFTAVEKWNVYRLEMKWEFIVFQWNILIIWFIYKHLLIPNLSWICLCRIKPPLSEPIYHHRELLLLKYQYFYLWKLCFVISFFREYLLSTFAFAISIGKLNYKYTPTYIIYIAFA